MAQVHPTPRASATIPASAGIGLRQPHHAEVIHNLPKVGWFEVHSENYFGQGGPALRYLEQVRSNYPVSLHGVGLSIGSSDPISGRHLARLEALIDRIEPGLVSEHLSWGSVDGAYLNDLIPLPYTEEVLSQVVDRVSRIQDCLRRQILLENPSSYLEYRHSVIPEAAFLAEAARRSGCGVLLDVNNVFVSCTNHGWDATDYLRQLPAPLIKEIHLAGHSRNRIDGVDVLIDTHDRPVSDAVWQLYAHAVQCLGPRPTLIEWDAAIPPLATLQAEAGKADRYLGASHARAA